MIKKTFLLVFILFSLILVIITMIIVIDTKRLEKRNLFPGDKAIHVFNYGWHMGLVFAVQDLPKKYVPYFAMLKGHRFIEVSWGDEKFYRNQNPRISWMLALRALLLPTSSILHVVGFDLPVDHFYRWSRYYTILLSDQEFDDLMQFICSYFVTDVNHKFVIVDRGLYGDSWFLKSRGIYMFPNTCNVWTAKALKSAHLPLTPIIYQYSSFLVKVLKQLSQKQQQYKKVRLVTTMAF